MFVRNLQGVIVLQTNKFRQGDSLFNADLYKREEHKMNNNAQSKICNEFFHCILQI